MSSSHTLTLTLFFFLLLIQSTSSWRFSSLNSFSSLTRSSLFRSNSWNPQSWKGFTAEQQPLYSDMNDLEDVISQLRKKPPLVQYEDIRSLKNELSKASHGQGFVIMGGDCAESFSEFSETRVRDSALALTQMSLFLSHSLSLPITRIGRIAGQFAKPRSEPVEVRGSLSLPSYRGDIINSANFSEQSRTPQASRMLQAYSQSEKTIEILKSLFLLPSLFLSQIKSKEFLSHYVEDKHKYMELSKNIEKNLLHFETLLKESRGSYKKFMEEPLKIFTAHECLLLPYEEAFVVEEKKDSNGNSLPYSSSASFLWIGERTRQLNNSHVEFLRGLDNPIGVKISSKITPEELVNLLDKLNPKNEPGKITLIVRMGENNLHSHLPSLVRAVQSHSKEVLWVCDPMHANTETIEVEDNGDKKKMKTRRYEKILGELRAFVEIISSSGAWPGGIHLEMTGRRDITECVGGNVGKVSTEDVSRCYETLCDPRLNYGQSLELSLEVAEMMKGK